MNNRSTLRLAVLLTVISGAQSFAQAPPINPADFRTGAASACRPEGLRAGRTVAVG